MKLDELMQSFAKAYQLAELQASEDGSYTLSIDETFSVHCRREGMGVVVFTTQLLPLPETLAQGAPLISKLMQYAYANIGRHRLILSIDKDNQLLVYQRLTVSNISNMGFNQALNRFVNQAEEFVRLIKT